MMKADARHELRLHACAQPALPALLLGGHLTGKMRRVPLLGWVVTDPVLARKILARPDRFSIFADGASGDWWSQVLGTWVSDLFAGQAHLDLRSSMGDVFGAARAEELINSACAPMLNELRDGLASGASIDLAAFSRVFTTRMMNAALGMPEDLGDADQCERIFDAIGELTDLGKGSWRTTSLTSQQCLQAHAIVDYLGAPVGDAYSRAESDTFIGRCRDRGHDVEVTRGLSVLFLVAGTITLASTMGRMAALLNDSGSVPELLSSPERRQQAVREALRVTSSMPIVGRGVRFDTELSGHSMRSGDKIKIVLWTISNGPGGFNLQPDEAAPAHPFWFGSGPHYCLGPQFAETQLRHLLDALCASNQRWTVRRRRYGWNRFVPLYTQLEVGIA